MRRFTLRNFKTNRILHNRLMGTAVTVTVDTGRFHDLGCEWAVSIPAEYATTLGPLHGLVVNISVWSAWGLGLKSLPAHAIVVKKSNNK